MIKSDDLMETVSLKGSLMKRPASCIVWSQCGIWFRGKTMDDLYWLMNVTYLDHFSNAKEWYMFKMKNLKDLKRSLIMYKQFGLRLLQYKISFVYKHTDSEW